MTTSNSKTKNQLGQLFQADFCIKVYSSTLNSEVSNSRGQIGNYFYPKKVKFDQFEKLKAGQHGMVNLYAPSICSIAYQ